MKIAIVGGAPSSEMLAPYADTSYEIWVLGNRLDRYLSKRVSRVFEIHDNLSEHADPAKYIAWHVSHNIPLVVSRKFKDEFPKLDHIHEYPYGAVEQLYGHLYLTSSPAYMLAYALALYGGKLKEVGIYGVDLSISDHEYFWQRPCMEAWIGFAKGRGVKVTIPEVSHIGKSKYVEGRDWNGDTEIGVFSEESFGVLAANHGKAMENIRAQEIELKLKRAAHDGAQQVYQNLAKVARAVDAEIDVKSLLETTVLR